MIGPPVWTEQQLTDASTVAIKRFRDERLTEPLEKYLDAFDKWQRHFEDLLESLVDLGALSEIRDSMLVDALSDPHMQTAFRYLAGPPISKDDLQTIAEVPSLSPSAMTQETVD